MCDNNEEKFITDKDEEQKKEQEEQDLENNPIKRKFKEIKKNAKILIV